ncbi:hypothetical protein IAG25_30595 [Caballeronia sp. EK]|uniref:hypothetical protein n=1 Tax=Caballeronia sp. EK TaxID=2767469 RepID=UPI0016555337|nr:hypothetical protein [Caballeronia sp. EK]MBC8641173.1 hypothetical protein [Caballeronia sp. EK]
MERARSDDLGELEAIRRKIDDVLEKARTVVGFLEGIEAEGIKVAANITHTGLMHGFRFIMGNASCVGAQLGRPYVWANLAKHLNYEPAADNPVLRARRVISRKQAVKPQNQLTQQVPKAESKARIGGQRGRPGATRASPRPQETECHTPDSRDASPVEAISANIVPFEFSSHASQELVRDALIGYAKGNAAGRIFIDHAPTGTGKSWAIVNEIVAQVRTWRTRKTILCLAPEKRHLAALLVGLKAGLPDTPVLTLRAKGDALVEHGIPPACPLREHGADKKLVQAVEHAIELVRNNAAAPQIASYKAVLGHERENLWKGCRKWVEAQGRQETPNVTACRSCLSMFPGNRLFEPRDGPLVALATYEKLYFGLDAFEIEHGKTSITTYSAFVSKPSGLDRPFEDCTIICEEYSHGHQRVTQQIEENALIVSVFEAAESVVRSFRDVYQKVSMEIEDHDTALHAKIAKRLLDIGNEVSRRRGEFWLVREDVRPFRMGRACLLLKPEDARDMQSFVASLSPAYSSLFPSDKLGVALDEIATEAFGEDCYRARVRRFPSSASLKECGYGSLPLAAQFARARTLEPIAWCAEQLTDILTRSLPRERKEQLINYFFQGVSQRDPSLIEYLRSLMWRRHAHVDSLGAAYRERNLLDEFYLRGYELLEARLADDGFQVRVLARLSRSSPEAMLHHLATAGNVLYISSASVPIRSAINNSDFDWVRRMGHPIQLLAQAAGERLMAEKALGKPTPQIIWGDPAVSSLINLTFTEKTDPNAMLDTLNVFADTLAGDADAATASRYAILFFNSKQNCEQAKAAFEQLAVRDGLDIHCYVVAAETFASGDMTRISEEIARHLQAQESPRCYLIFATYAGLATGANLHVDLTHLASLSENLLAYVGGGPLRQHVGSDKASVDLSDIVLVEPLTNFVNANNFYRVGHQLAALGDTEWRRIGREIFRKGPLAPWYLTSAAVRRTRHYAALQFNAAMQSIGRMDRTLNAAAVPRVFLNRHFAPIFAAVDADMIGETFLSPTIQSVIDSAQARLADADMLERVDCIEAVELSSSEFFTYLATLVRQDDMARRAWLHVRSYLARHQVISHKILDDADANREAIDATLAKYGVSLRDFYFDIPNSHFWANSHLSDNNGTYQLGFEREEHRFLFWPKDEAPLTTALTYRGPLHAPRGGALFVRPDLMHEVVVAVEYENDCRRLIEQFCKKKVLPEEDVLAYLFERGDLFIQQCDACVDAKAWSRATMESASNQASLEKLIEDARMKMRFMQAEAPPGAWVPKRYLYAFKHWWPALAEHQGRLAVFFQEDAPVPAANEGWDVGFVHVAEHWVIGTVLDGLDRGSAP